MLDHIGIRVSDSKRACQVYQTLLAPLGVTHLVTEKQWHGFGREVAFLWLKETASSQPSAQPLYFGINVDHTSYVDSFVRAAYAGNLKVAGAPKQRREYGMTYYGAFVEDIDGNVIGVLCRDQASRHDEETGA